MKMYLYMHFCMQSEHNSLNIYWNVKYFKKRSHTETCNINFMSSIQSSASLTAFCIIKQRKQAYQKYYTVLSTYFSMCFIILFLK